MGGGILPVALKNGKLYFLFGLENELDDTQGWADFGGGNEHDESSFDTAAREGCEELNGFLGCENTIKSRMIKNKIIHISYKSSSYKKPYTSYLFEVDYDEKMPHYYNNNYQFFIKYLPHIKKDLHNGLLEKMEIKWFSIDDIKNERNFRPFFQNIINKLLKKENEIMRVLTKTRTIHPTRKLKHKSINKNTRKN